MQDQIKPHTVSAVVGRHVFTADGAYVGDVTDLVFDSERGMIRFAVVVPGGPFGVEGRWLCVPFEALRHSAEHDCFVLSRHPSMLNAPPCGEDLRQLVLSSRLTPVGARSSSG